MRRKIGGDGIQEKDDATPVNAPMQNVSYFNMYYQIDNKLNQIEEDSVLGKQGSKKHGWAPKLSF